MTLLLPLKAWHVFGELSRLWLWLERRKLYCSWSSCLTVLWRAACGLQWYGNFVHQLSSKAEAKATVKAACPAFREPLSYSSWFCCQVKKRRYCLHLTNLGSLTSFSWFTFNKTVSQQLLSLMYCHCAKKIKNGVMSFRPCFPCGCCYFLTGWLFLRSLTPPTLLRLCHGLYIPF